MLKKPVLALVIFVTLIIHTAKPIYAYSSYYDYFFILPGLVSALNSLLENFTYTDLFLSQVNHLKNEYPFNALSLRVLSVSDNNIPSEAPEVSPTPNITPTITPSQITKSTETNPLPTAIPHNSPNVNDYILNQINNYRKSLGLTEVRIDTHTCSFARTRLHEITASFNHDGFVNRWNNQTLPYPTLSEASENIAMNPDFKQVFDTWKNSPGHSENMRKDTPFVCIEYAGNYYVYEGWRP